MLSTILISIAVVLVVFAVANKYAKKKEQPAIPTVDDEPLGYETSSLATVIEREESSIELIAPEIVIEKEPKVEQPKPKTKKKMSAKPKAKAPKKKKDA